MKNKRILQSTAGLIVSMLILSSCSNTQIQTEETYPPRETLPPITVQVITSSPDEETDEPVYVPSNETIEADITAKYAAVLDCESGELLYVKGWGEKIYPASTTKLLTALFALQVCDPKTEFTPGDELDFVAYDASIAYIKPNHRLTLEMLIEGMLLPSGNDAAYVIAAGVGRQLAGEEGINASEAVVKFMTSMNAYAQKIGLHGTQFTCPDGYHDPNHYTTLEDMLEIAKLAAEDPIISKYAAMASDSVTYASGHTNEWKNSNSLIDKYNKEMYYEYATGLKTGTTDEAGACLVASAEKNGRRVIVCVFGSESSGRRFHESKELFEKAYDLIEKED